MSDKHDAARDLTEQALDKLEQGDEKAADRLIDKAKGMDKSAVEEVVKDLDEDAAAKG
ncbi:MAG: hypothetical protein H7Z10_01650 [Gemmatimonadaceae bacterium]|nr:hypothetical protein [Acetobacteraceae bacterium]